MTPQKERDRFYQAIGFAISQWAHVEAALANIFVYLVAAQDGGAANAAFFSAINFSLKLEMVDAAATIHLHEPQLLKQWSDLRRELNSKSKIRNNLAHFMSVIRVDKADKYTYYLEQNVFDLKRLLKAKAPKYNCQNIEYEAARFGELAEKLTDLLPKIPVPDQRA